MLLVLNAILGFAQSGTADITPLGLCGGWDNPSFIFNSVNPPSAGPFGIGIYTESGIYSAGSFNLGDTITIGASGTFFYVGALGSGQFYYSDTVNIGESTWHLCAPCGTEMLLSGESFIWPEAGIDTVMCVPGDHQITYSTVVDQYGCTADTARSVHVDPYIPSICVVTDQDNDGHNEVVFDISGGADYNIYRGSTFLTTRLSTDNSYYEDTEALNGEFAYTYSIEAIDVCGTTPTSTGHTSIKLTTGSAPDSNTVNLTWNSYEGIDFTDEYYVIERTRGQQTDSIWGIPVVDYDQNPSSVTLSGHQAGDIYQVIVDLELTCSPQRSEAPTIRSNLLNPNATGIVDVEALKVILPNPSDGLHLQSDRALDVTVTDINGRLIASHQGVAVVNEHYRSGMYFVNLTDGVHVVTKRLVVTR